MNSHKSKYYWGANFSVSEGKQLNSYYKCVLLYYINIHKRIGENEIDFHLTKQNFVLFFAMKNNTQYIYIANLRSIDVGNCYLSLVFFLMIY